MILLLFLSMDCFIIRGALWLAMPYSETEKIKDSITNAIAICVVLGCFTLLFYLAFMIESHKYGGY